MKKRIFIGLLLLFVISNPTNTDYINYLKSQGEYDTRPNQINGGRSSYFLIGSIYKNYNQTYLGIFKNFFRVDRLFYSGLSPEEKAANEKTFQDSIAAAEQAAAASQSAMMDSTEAIRVDAAAWSPDPLEIIPEKPEFDKWKKYEVKKDSTKKE